MPATKVLVVDDSALMRRAIKEILTGHGDFEVQTARNGVDALDQLERAAPDVVTLDVNMPEMDGLSCLVKIMEVRPTPVVMVSSLTERNALVTFEALELGAVDYVAKPGGTVSTNMVEVADELISKVRGAAQARVRRATWRPPAPAAEAAATAAEAGTSARAKRAPLRTELVIVGSSTGGPALLGDLFARLPANFPAPIVVAQHIPATFSATLARRIDDASALRAHEVDRIMTVRPGNIYIGRGNADVVVARRMDGMVVKSVPASEQYRWHPSVDRLVASARRTCEPRRLVGVLLTGMGDDGADELRAVHLAGGRTVAEAESTAVVWGMPGELVRRGGATAVLPSHEIVDRLVDWVC